MERVFDGCKVAPHGMFYMESAGGCPPEQSDQELMDERRPSCFALEEEKGEHWKDVGEKKPLINASRPRL